MNWWLGTIVLLIVGMVFQLGMLVYAMYVMLGVLVVSRYFSKEWINAIQVDRECNRSALQIGDKVAVIVDVKNKGVLPIPWLLVEDAIPKSFLTELPKRLTVTGRRIQLFKLFPRAQKSIRYQVEFHRRGYYQLGPMLIESGDLFGLHRRFRIETKPHFVIVYPKVIPLNGYNLASRRPIGEVLLAHRLFEDPTRIAGVREYQPGDSLNRIHWKATARTGTLHSKIYEPSSVAGMTLLVDFHHEGYPARAEPMASDLVVTAAASLASAVSQLNQQVGLITNGRDAADRIRQQGVQHEFRTRTFALRLMELKIRNERLEPVIIETRRGVEQFQRILDTLARLELTGGLKFPELVQETMNSMPRDATVVVILARVTPEIAMTLGQLRRKGFAVSVMLVMADEHEVRDMMGMLIAEHVPVRQIENEQAISNLCSELVVR